MKRALFAIAVFVLFAAPPALGQDGQLPDRTKTPGVALKKVPDEKASKCLSDLMGKKIDVGDTISSSMICTANYDKCIRDVSSEEKKAVYNDYGIPGGDHTGICDVDQGCEVDHLISIELGGSNDQKNLWPQPYEGLQFNAHVKDRLENWFHAHVCSGAISLKTAQKEISEDWVAAFKKRIGPDPDSE
jgi:hypothetical protein